MRCASWSLPKCSACSICVIISVRFSVHEKRGGPAAGKFENDEEEEDDNDARAAGRCADCDACDECGSAAERPDFFDELARLEFIASMFDE